MGLKERLNQGLPLSECMTIEFINNFDLEHQPCLPGSHIAGHVVIRNPRCFPSAPHCRPCNFRCLHTPQRV